MTLERLVLIIIWTLSVLAIILFIPKNKRREAVLSFLACQAITWVNSMLHVKYGLLEFPVREFPKSNRSFIHFGVYDVSFDVFLLYYS